jgi:hypothetical protein
MPAFDKFAYTDGRHGMKTGDLVADARSPATLSRARSIPSSISHAKVVGKGTMDRAKCIEYCGSDVDACQEFKK